MHKLPSTIVSLLILLSFIGMSQRVSAVNIFGRYSTDRLLKLASKIGLTSVTDTLSDGNYCGTYYWNKHPLNIKVRDNEVSHIGIKLFTSHTREGMPASPVYDFIERYLLEYLAFGGKTEFGIDRLKVDDVIVETGRFDKLPTIASDTTLAFSWTLDKSHKYSLIWSRDDHELFRISFPASNKLLKGYTFDEGEQKLAKRIARTDTLLRNSKEVEISNLLKCDSLQGSYYIKKGNYCIIPLINNDTYYSVVDSMAQLLFAPAYPVESLANLLISGEIPCEFTANIRMARYGGKAEEFSVPLQSLLNYFIEEGCTPFFGLKGINPGLNRISALFEMVNEMNGYEHLMSVSFDYSNFSSSKGEIDIRLTPYLPLQDIQSLFAH